MKNERIVVKVPSELKEAAVNKCTNERRVLSEEVRLLIQAWVDGQIVIGESGE